MELQKLNELFDFAKQKRIVLYGIGALAKSILDVMSEYTFVGLMDRDSANVGKMMYGLPIMSPEQAAENADVILIAADEAYWEIIYSRIMDLEDQVDIFFLNGEKAHLSVELSDEPYWKISEKQLLDEIDRHDVISFDLYDTLISRDVLYREDVYELMVVKYNLGSEFALARKNAEAVANNRYAAPGLEDIYRELSEIYDSKAVKDSDVDSDEGPLGAGDIKSFDMESLKESEMQLEEMLSTPRKEMVRIANEAHKNGKDVCIVTDMYLPKEVIFRIIKKCGIEFDPVIFLSCELNSSKSDGSIWQYLKESYENKSILHVGDNGRTDCELPRNYGIDTFEVWSTYQMLMHSSVKGMASISKTLNQNIVCAMISNRLFNNPFCLYGSQGVPIYISQYLYGGVGYGFLLYNYMIWLIKEHREYDYKLFFFARDGYLLCKLFDCVRMNHETELPESLKAVYFKTSRRLATVASFYNKKDILDACELKYSGTLSDFMINRLGVQMDDRLKGSQTDGRSDKEGNVENIELYADVLDKDSQIVLPADKVKVWNAVEPYADDILNNSAKERECYLRYVNSVHDMGKPMHIVDPSFLGTTQYFLEKVLGQDIQGYYMLAKRNAKNPYGIGERVNSLYSGSDDDAAEMSLFRKKIYFLEGVLVAPEGMYLSCDENGEFINDAPGENQKNWKLKEELHDGILEFAHRMEQIHAGISIADRVVECEFVNQLEDILLSDRCRLCDSIKESFWHECIYMPEKVRKIFG